MSDQTGARRPLGPALPRSRGVLSVSGVDFFGQGFAHGNHYPLSHDKSLPPKIADGQRVQVYLDPDSLDTAARIGDGRLLRQGAYPNNRLALSQNARIASASLASASGLLLRNAFPRT